MFSSVEVWSVTQVTAEDRKYIPQCPQPQGLDAFLEAMRFLFTSALGFVPNTSQVCIIGFKKILCKVRCGLSDPDRPALAKTP